MKLSFVPDILFEAIQAIEEHKRKAGLLPDHALLVELRERFPNVGREEFNEVVAELKASEKVKAGRTINDFYLKSVCVI